jgi:hypothetical protein
MRAPLVLVVVLLAAGAHAGEPLDARAFVDEAGNASSTAC